MTSDAQFDTLEVSRDGEILSVALNRPDVRNAFNAQMIAELTELFGSIGNAGERAVVLKGNGRSFSAGADVTWMRASLDYSRNENLADAQRMSDMFAAIDECPVPVICRVHGAALGGGMGLMAVCDIVVAAEGTVFGFTETKLGIIPAVISRFVLPKIGESWARALFLTGERFGADVARQIGLVHWIVSDDALDETVAAKVGELASAGPGAAREAKRLVADSRGLDSEGLRDLTASRIAILRTAPEGQEGLRAFLDKRSPSWRE